MHLKSSCNHISLAILLATVCLILLQFAQTSNCLRFWSSSGAATTTTTPTPQLPSVARRKGDSPAGERPDDHEARNQADDKMRPSKPNKVSKVLHFLHRKSEDLVYAKPDENNHADKKSDQDEGVESDRSATLGVNANKQHATNDDDDDEIIGHICDQKPSQTCKQALALALKSSPETRARIARAFRTKPDHVNATKLLLLKLFEASIDKLESKGYDEKLDKVIDLAAKRNPYLFAASKAYDLLGAARL